MLSTMKNKKLKLAISIACNILGNLIYAFGVIAFCEPNHLITGGVTGISLALHYAFGWNTSIFAAMLNVFFFFLGLIFLGKRFALSTLLSSIVYPLWMLLLEQFDYSYFMVEGDILIPILAGSVFIGSGIALVIRTGGSTGGLDIPVLMLNKFLGFPVALGIFGFDFGIIFVQAFIPGNTWSVVAYGFLMAVVYSSVINRVLVFGNDKLEIKIMSKKKDELSEMILHKMDRGLTYLHSETGFLREERDFILTVVDIRELSRFKSMIYTIDPEAFVVISSVQEVKGKGFSEAKTYTENKE